MPKILNPQLGKSTSLGVNAFLRLKTDLTREWVAETLVAGGGLGDVVGPVGATDNAIARFDTTTGKLLQNSTPLVQDDGRISLVTDPSSAQDAATKAYVDTEIATTGTVTHTGALTADQLVVGNGTGDEKVLPASANGQIPIGKASDGTVVMATITAGSNVTVTNGAGTITIAASGGGTASPSFAYFFG